MKTASRSRKSLPLIHTSQDWQEQADRLQKRVAALEALQQVARSLTSELDLDQLLAKILQYAVQVMQATAGSLLLHDPATNELVFEVVQGGGGEALRHKRIRTDQGIAGAVFTSGQPAIVADAQADQRHMKGFAERFGFHTNAMIVAPLLHKGNSIGVIEVLNKKSGEPFDTDDQDLLLAFAAQSAVAIENARLYQQIVAERNRILTDEDRVRTELARDLHDGITQILAAIIMNLRFLKEVLVRKPERVKDEIIQVEELASRALLQTRNLLFDLRPIILETKGLFTTLEIYVERQRASKEIDIQLDADDFSGRLDPKAEAAIFSIIQEAVNNVKKHADASHIWIAARLAKDALTFSVKDDGRGFEVSSVEEEYAQRGSLGLLNIKERAELANGKLIIASAPGKGTEITLIVPLNANG